MLTRYVTFTNWKVVSGLRNSAKSCNFLLAGYPKEVVLLFLKVRCETSALIALLLSTISQFETSIEQLVAPFFLSFLGNYFCLVKWQTFCSQRQAWKEADVPRLKLGFQIRVASCDMWIVFGRKRFLSPLLGLRAPWVAIENPCFLVWGMDRWDLDAFDLDQPSLALIVSYVALKL